MSGSSPPHRWREAGAVTRWPAPVEVRPRPGAEGSGARAASASPTARGASRRSRRTSPHTGWTCSASRSSTAVPAPRSTISSFRARVDEALATLGPRAIVLARRPGVDLRDPGLAMASACEAVSAARRSRGPPRARPRGARARLRRGGAPLRPTGRRRVLRRRRVDRPELAPRPSTARRAAPHLGALQR